MKKTTEQMVDFVEDIYKILALCYSQNRPEADMIEYFSTLRRCVQLRNDFKQLTANQFFFEMDFLSKVINNIINPSQEFIRNVMRYI